MERRTYTGLEFFEGFIVFAACLWIGGALLVGGLVMASHARQVAPADAAANATPVAETPATQ